MSECAYVCVEKPRSKGAGVFHLCITFFTSASVESGTVSDRVDKTPNG
ncbi:hypothetical protein R3I94_002767 [Phoxinus phoxinus]